MLTARIDAISDRGLKRLDNQDNYYISPDGRVLAVADGIGGLKGGAKASQLAVDSVSELWQSNKPDQLSAEEIQAWLAEAITQANKSIFDTGRADPSCTGMGTTIVVAVHSQDDRLHIAHVGDSRAYLIRDKKAVVLTQDHSLLMELTLSGKLTPEEAKKSWLKNFITRCVGHNDAIEVDHTPLVLKDEDWIILCTDGLSSLISEEDIAETVLGSESTNDACKILLDKTLGGGAPDNVTIITARFMSQEKGQSRKPTTTGEYQRQ